MKRIGLMGCGSVADFGHLPAIKHTPELTLHAVYDPEFERAVIAQKRHGAAHAFCDPELFFASGLDAVTIASPAPTHKANVLECASRGLPVLCEKPLAMDDTDAEQMISAMEKAGLPLAVGFCYRFSPVALEIARLVQARRVGEVRALRLIYIWNLHGIYEPDDEGKQVYSPRRLDRMAEGGPLVDCGVHQIDLARWWLSREIIDWSAVGAWVEDHEAPDHAYLHLRHSGGALTTVEVSYTYTHTAHDPISHFTYQLIGTEGVIRYDREAGLFEVRHKDGIDILPWSHEKNFEGMYAAWSAALESGEMGNMPTGADGLVATQIARRATEAMIATRRSGPSPGRPSSA
ncbi:MAG: Gfo/Idh/MocA family protein [Fimbriimonadaceae bacterium]